MNLKVAEITIKLHDIEQVTDSPEFVTILHRGLKSTAWEIKGMVFPRHIKLMDSINDYLKNTEGTK